VIGMARTGSGKTAAFVLPMLHKLAAHAPKAGARGLILAPTRELALQTHKVRDLCARLVWFYAGAAAADAAAANAAAVAVEVAAAAGVATAAWACVLIQAPTRELALHTHKVHVGSEPWQQGSKVQLPGVACAAGAIETATAGKRLQGWRQQQQGSSSSGVWRAGRAEVPGHGTGVSCTIGGCHSFQAVSCNNRTFRSQLRCKPAGEGGPDHPYVTLCHNLPHYGVTQSCYTLQVCVT
jgi:hypothetical protein